MVVARFNGDGLNDKVSQDTGITFTDPSLTKQADAAAADINTILKRYEKTGTLPDMIKSDPMWGDFSDVPSFQEAFALVAKSEEQFAALDAPVRKRFDNDPAKFLAFATDPANSAEMVALGLAVEKTAAPPPAASGAASGATLAAPLS